jgi:hypothetical protein
VEFASGLSLPFNSGDGEYVTWVYGMSCSCLVQVQVRLHDGMVRNEHREPCAHSDVVLQW